MLLMCRGQLGDEAKGFQVMVMLRQACDYLWHAVHTARRVRPVRISTCGMALRIFVLQHHECMGHVALVTVQPLARGSCPCMPRSMRFAQCVLQAPCSWYGWHACKSTPRSMRIVCCLAAQIFIGARARAAHTYIHAYIHGSRGISSTTDGYAAQRAGHRANAAVAAPSLVVGRGLLTTNGMFGARFMG